MMNKTPSVVTKSKFFEGQSTEKNSSSSSSYDNFLNYMDRAESKEGTFENFNDYMSDKEKSTGLFSNSKDYLDKDEKDKFKKTFKKSQEKGSVLWTDIISFDNEWLKEIGVIENNKVNESKLKNITRETMNEMLKSENISDSAVWTGAIHYNTDNIHIHTATVQTYNFKKRGKRKPKTLSDMKSNVLNKLIDRTKENEKINFFIRDKLVDTKKENPIPTLKNKIHNREMVKQFNKIYESLPEDKRKWKYNMNSMKEFRPEIDKLTDMYIKNNFNEDFKSFEKQINENVDFYKRSYGSNSKADNYKENVYDDMYSRMGNTILKEMNELEKKDNKKNNPFLSRKKELQNKIKLKKEVNNSVYKIDRHMNDNLQNIKNQNEFKKLEREQELER